MTNEISQQISKSRNLLSILDLSADEILGICNRGKEIKEKFNLGITPDTKPLKNYCGDIPYSTDEAVSITCEWLLTQKK